MADEKPQGVTGTISGWIKAVITSVIGLVSGAFLMYLTPVVNSAIKPAKPVSNFAVQVGGLVVEFNNRSTGAVQGWWDFGDGTALEPFDPKAETVKHTYAAPGTYSVKLSLQNLIGEESDRTTQVKLDGVSVSVPEIELFELKPLVPNNDRVPAVFRLVSKVKNANYLILSVGDSRPTEIIDAAANQERYITFEEMGAFNVRLAAVNGKQLVEKSQDVYVAPGDAQAPMAKLHVTYQAVKVERLPPRDWRIYCGWPADSKETVVQIRREHLVTTPEYTIVSAELVNKDEKNCPARKMHLEIAPDRKKVVLTGEMTKPGGFLAPKTAPPVWVGHVKVVLEKRSPPEARNLGDVVMPVDLNTTMKIPMQHLEPGWEVVGKQVSMELWDGARKVWENNKACTNAKVMLKNQECLVTMAPQTDCLLLKVDCAVGGGAVSIPTMPPTVQHGPVIRPAGFDRNPFLPKRP
jgi:PKD repeat protein